MAKVEFNLSCPKVGVHSNELFGFPFNVCYNICGRDV